jgi:hypothetical protein
MNTIFFRVLLTFGVICIGPACQAGAQRGATDLSNIVITHSRYPQQIHSLQTRFRAENRVTPEYLQMLQRVNASRPASGQMRPPRSVQRWEIIYAVKGKKYFWQQKSDDPTRDFWTGVCSDGKNTFYPWYNGSSDTGPQRIRSATKTTGVRLTLPPVLAFGYQLADKHAYQWIGDLLRAGTFRLTGTETDPQFGTLYRVQGPIHQELVTFWFAPRYGYLAVRTERKPEDGKGSRTVYRITSLQQTDGFWFAKRAVRETFKLPANALHVRYSIDVSNIQINAAPDSLFELNLPPGATFADPNSNVNYIVGEQGKKLGD